MVSAIRSFEESELRDVIDLAHDGPVDLTEVIKSPLGVADSGWLDVAQELAEALTAAGGSWVISVPLGTTPDLPPLPIDLDSAVALVSDTTLSPPEATLLKENELVNPLWNGEVHEWRDVIRPRVVRRIFFTKWLDPNADGTEPYDCRVDFSVVESSATDQPV